MKREIVMVVEAVLKTQGMAIIKVDNIRRIYFNGYQCVVPNELLIYRRSVLK
jgi:hypothetical protein